MIIAWSIKHVQKFQKLKKKIDFWGSDLIDDGLIGKKNRQHYSILQTILLQIIYCPCDISHRCLFPCHIIHSPKVSREVRKFSRKKFNVTMRDLKNCWNRNSNARIIVKNWLILKLNIWFSLISFKITDYRSINSRTLISAQACAILPSSGG